MRNEMYERCIRACQECATVCRECASACLKEDNVKMMARCIQLDMECATMCTAAASVMGLGGQMADRLCALCAEICRACGDECGRHKVEHCRICAEACYRCAEECRSMSGVAA